MAREKEFRMPQNIGTSEPWVYEDRECSWRLVGARTRGRRRAFVGWGKSEKKGGVSIEMFDN